MHCRFAALSAADEALSTPVTSVVDNEKRELPSTITAYLNGISAIASLVQAASSPSVSEAGESTESGSPRTRLVDSRVSRVLGIVTTLVAAYWIA